MNSEFITFFVCHFLINVIPCGSFHQRENFSDMVTFKARSSGQRKERKRLKVIKESCLEQLSVRDLQAWLHTSIEGLVHFYHECSQELPIFKMQKGRKHGS